MCIIFRYSILLPYRSTINTSLANIHKNFLKRTSSSKKKQTTRVQLLMTVLTTILWIAQINDFSKWDAPQLFFPLSTFLHPICRYQQMLNLCLLSVSKLETTRLGKKLYFPPWRSDLEDSLLFSAHCIKCHIDQIYFCTDLKRSCIEN